MTDQQTIFDRLRQTMALTFNVSPDVIRETTRQEDVGSWDSLGHINLIVALETTFGVTFEIEDIVRLTSIPVIMAYLSGPDHE